LQHLTDDAKRILTDPPDDVELYQNGHAIAFPTYARINVSQAFR
jgi:hypothetical protein